MRKSIFFFFLLLYFFVPNTYSGEITLDEVGGCSWNDGWETYVMPDRPFHFVLRYNNNSDQYVKGMTNGFRVWTLGGTPFKFIGAEMSEVDFGGGTDWYDIFDLGLWIDYFSADGLGADTVGLSAAVMFGDGIPPYANKSSLIIYIDSVENGETICIDSSFFPPGGTWLWAMSYGGATVPSWDGPHCFRALEPPCLSPYFENCVTDLYLPQHQTVSYDFDASGTPSVGYLKVYGPGTIDNETGLWEYEHLLGDPLTQTLIVGAYDPQYCGQCIRNECFITLHFIENNPPVIDCVETYDTLAASYTYNFQMTATDPDPNPICATSQTKYP